MQKAKASKSGFVPPNKARLEKALGDFSKENMETRKALSNLNAFYEPIRPPKPGDWLDTFNHGCVGYD